MTRTAIRVVQSACGPVEDQQPMQVDLQPIDKTFVAKGPWTLGTDWWPGPAPVARSVGDVSYHNQRLALFLPCFYPDFTLMAPINRFYPAFTLFWRVKCVGLKRRVKTGWNGPFLLVTIWKKAKTQTFHNRHLPRYETLASTQQRVCSMQKTKY